MDSKATREAPLYRDDEVLEAWEHAAEAEETLAREARERDDGAAARAAWHRAAWYRVQSGEPALAGSNLLRSAYGEPDPELRAAALTRAAELLMACGHGGLGRRLLAYECDSTADSTPGLAARLGSRLASLSLLQGDRVAARRWARWAQTMWHPLLARGEMCPADWQGWMDTLSVQVAAT